MRHVYCVGCQNSDSGQRPFSKTSTGFEFEPLPNSDVLIRFQADDGTPINTQIVTREVLCRLPVVVHAFFLAVNEGQEAARDFLSRFQGNENTNLLSGGDR